MLQMGKIFAGLVLWNLILFAITIGLGLTHHSAHWQHQALGVVTGIYTCLTHSIVLMHFMGSGRAIKEAVAEHALTDHPVSGFRRRSRRLHARASALATLGCVFIIVAAWLGAWTDTHRSNGAAHAWHVWFVWFTVAYNLYAFRVEYRVIRENTELIREVNRQITPAA